MASVDGSKSVQVSSDDGSQFDCSPCDYEGVKRKAKYYCPQCHDYLCDSCKSVHQKISATRKHLVVFGSLMPTKREDKSNEDIKSRFQCSCNRKDVTVYCKDDNEVMCVDCKTLKHRNCRSSKIEEACAGLDTADTNSTKERMKAVKTKLEILQQKRTEDTENLTANIAECRDIVINYKKELMKKIEELTDNALDDLAKCDSKQRLIIEQHINTCSTALHTMELDYEPFEEATISGMKPLMFVRNLQLKKTIDHVDHILQEIEKEVKKPGVSFSYDETLRMTKIKSLGIVKSTAVKDARPVVADMGIQSITQVDVKSQSDQREPWISGSLFMPNGELILCDRINVSVKVLNTDFTQKEQIKMSSRPWDFCLMETDEIVVTQPDAKSLLFMKVVPKLQTGSSLTVDQNCRGVAVKDGFIYVSFDNGEVRLIDRAGQQQRNIYSGFRFKTPYYISVTQTGLLYVSEHDGHNIRVLKDGKEISNYSNAGLREPLGMYIDGAENILVCEFSSNNLRIIGINEQVSKVLLSGSDGLNQPYTISFRASDRTLMIGGWAQHKLIVCKMASA